AVDVATRPLRVAGRAVDVVRHPRRAAEGVAEGAKGIRDLLVGPLLSPAPSVPLNQPIGPHRRVEWTTFALDDFKAVKNALGGTVNDVVLATVAGALREWLKRNGTGTEGLELRAMVPVSVRSEGEKNQFGNRVAAMRGPLPVYAADPVERLRLVTAAMQDLKASKQAVGAEVLANLQEFAPPTLLALGSRINFSTRLFNTVVTNVPGPQFPLYLLGREMTEMVPLGFLAANHTVFFAIMSYNGKLAIGLLGDRDAMTELDTIAEGLRTSLDELKRAAGVTDRHATRRRRSRERAAAVTTTNGSGH
ncbi:MAG TPA: WS/DGAT domain-containing protein, partial [Actinomycetota bacterium]|nr:WS/DGAT domain-containing protein [Actinomycetota bacterium]